MKTVIITGAGGFIGRALVEHFLKQGRHVTAVARDVSKLAGLACKNLSVVEADFNAYGELSEKTGPADVFYHFAWEGISGKGAGNYAIQTANIEATCTALEQAVKSGCGKFVFAGTVAELEIIEHIDQNLCRPRRNCIYAGAKLCAEMMCKTLATEYGIAFNAGLLANTFGPGDRSRRSSNIIINHFNRGQPPKLVKGEALNDWVYIEDTVRLLEAMGERGIPMKTYYIGHTELRPLRAIIEDVRDTLAPGMNLKFGEMPDVLTNYTYISTRELYEDTGIRAEFPFDEAVRNTSAWVRTLDMEL